MTQKLRITLLLALLGLVLMGASAQAAILELSGPAGASVTVNGRARGFFPLEHPLDLGPGTYLVECTLPGYKNYTWEIFLADESDWKRLHVRLTKYRKRTALGSNILLAGMGQHYLDKPFKGWVFNIAEAGGLIAALYAESSRVNYRKDYLLLLDKYNAAINATDLAYYKEQTEKAYQEMQDMESLRKTGLIVAGSAIALSLLDAVINFPKVDAGLGSGVTPNTDTDAEFSLNNLARELTTVHAGIKLSF